jgi:glycosyltransferase involved in cell wall biosynthesis
MPQPTSSDAPRLGYIWDTPLKEGERHIRRQVLGSRRFEPVVLTRRAVSGVKRFPATTRVLTERRRMWVRVYRKYLLGQGSCQFNQIPEGLQALVQELRLRLLHVFFGTKGMFYLPALRSVEVPVSVSFHGADIARCAESDGGDGLQDLFARADCVMARSEHMAASLRRLGCAPEKLWINRAGVPLGEFPLLERERSAGHPFTFIQVCRLIPKKGIEDTIEAFEQVRRQLPGARLRIVGEGSLRSTLTATIERKGLADAIRLTGFVDPAALLRLLAEADLFLHPSVTAADGDREGIPNSLLEAMATGLATVATRHAGIPEAVVHGESGWLVPENDPARLAERMTWCARNPQALREAGAAARAFIEREHDLEQRMRLLDDKYEELIRAAGRSAAGPSAALAGSAR